MYRTQGGLRLLMSQMKRVSEAVWRDGISMGKTAQKLGREKSGEMLLCSSIGRRPLVALPQLSRGSLGDRGNAGGRGGTNFFT